MGKCGKIGVSYIIAGSISYLSDQAFPCGLLTTIYKHELEYLMLFYATRLERTETTSR